MIAGRRQALGVGLGELADEAAMEPLRLVGVESGAVDLRLLEMASIARALQCTLPDLLADHETGDRTGRR